MTDQKDRKGPPPAEEIILESPEGVKHEETVAHMLTANGAILVGTTKRVFQLRNGRLEELQFVRLLEDEE